MGRKPRNDIGPTACNGFGGGEAGGATNIPSVISHGRPFPPYTRKSTSQLGLPVNNINSMDRLKLLSTRFETPIDQNGMGRKRSKSGTDRTTKHTTELYIHVYCHDNIYLAALFFVTLLPLILILLICFINTLCM